MYYHTMGTLPRQIVVFFSLLGLILVGMSTVPQAQAQQNRPDLETYSSWVREALVAAQRRDRLGLEQVGEELITTREIETDGGPVSVDNRWLIDELERTSPNFERIEERLAAVLDALTIPANMPPADAQARLEELLSRPPFADPEPADLSWLERFFEWLGEFLDQFAGPAVDAGGASSGIMGWLLVGACFVILAGVLFYLVAKTRLTLTREAELEQSDDPETNLTANIALQQAGSLAQGGDYRTAVRYLYLSSLLWLEEHGMLRYDRSLTNFEYLASLSERPEIRARLVPIVNTFDQVWYGHADLDDESFRRYQQQVQELRQSPLR